MAAILSQEGTDQLSEDIGENTAFALQGFAFHTSSPGTALQKGPWALHVSSFSQSSASTDTTWDLKFSFEIAWLVLPSHSWFSLPMFTFCKAAFHPHHILDRCTARDAGISVILITGISMEITQTSLTIHMSSLQHTVSLLSVVRCRIFNLLGNGHFYNTNYNIPLNFYDNFYNKNVLKAIFFLSFSTIL